MHLFLLGHHPDGTDPVLLEWIKHVFDAVLGWGPGVWVAATGAVIVAIPVGILVVFWRQRRAARMPRRRGDAS